MLESARTDPSTLFIGIDPVAEAMAAAANRVRREKLENALFVVAAAEALPCELDGIAGRITVLFPWGSLLAGVIGDGQPSILSALRRIARPGAVLEVVINRSAERTGSNGLSEHYQLAGFNVEAMERVRVPACYRTTWGRRVTHDSDVLQVRACATFA